MLFCMPLHTFLSRAVHSCMSSAVAHSFLGVNYRRTSIPLQTLPRRKALCSGVPICQRWPWGTGSRRRVMQGRTRLCTGRRWSCTLPSHFLYTAINAARRCHEGAFAPLPPATSCGTFF